MHRILSCPLCGSANLQTQLLTTDYTTTGDSFTIERCTSCQFLLTNPQPTSEELPKYYQSESYVSHKENSKGLLETVYSIARKFTLSWKLELIKKHSLHTNSLLDLGCGAGDFLRLCQEKNISIAGVEPSPIARAIAQKKVSTQIHTDLSMFDSTVDVITAWHVIEHIPQLSETIHHLHQSLNKNGTMFIAVPNHESYDAQKYGNHWAAYDVPRHLWHFSKQTMTKLVTERGFDLIATVPMKLDAFYVSLLSEKYSRKKFSIISTLSAFITGLTSNLKANQDKNHSSLVYVFRKK